MDATPSRPDEDEPHYIIVRIHPDTKAYLYAFNHLLHEYRTVAILWCPTKANADYQNKRLASGWISICPTSFDNFEACAAEAKRLNRQEMERILDSPNPDAAIALASWTRKPPHTKETASA